MASPPTPVGRRAVAAAAAVMTAAVVAAAAPTTAAAVPAALPRLPASGGWGAWLRRAAAPDAAADVVGVDTAAAPPTRGWGLHPTSRVFPYSALAATYAATPAVTVDPTCPKAVTVGGGGQVDPATNVLILPLGSISEGTAQCRGGSMKVVRLPTILDADAMAAADLTAMSAALDASAPASSTVKSLNASTADALVGWDGVERICGSSTYPASTFYFFLVADEVIEVKVGGQDRGTIPTNQQAMIIAAGGTRICTLTADKKVAPTPAPSPAPSPGPSPAPPPVVSPAPSVAPPSPTAEASPSGEPEPTGGEEVIPSPMPTDPTDPAESDEPGGSLEPTGSPLATPIVAPDDGSACFPAAATLRRPGGEAVTMDALRVGDDVAVGGGHSSRVYLFSHADEAVVSSMVALTTAGAGTLTASADHLVYVASRDGRDRTAVAADTVATGDVLVSDSADAAAATVVAVERVRAAGLYAPHTYTGDLVVDGFVVSSYTRLLPPAVAHAVLAPVRAAAAAGVLPARLAQGGLWAGGETPRRAFAAAVAAVRAAVAGVAVKSDL